jgi:hypothetical protein
MKVLSHHQIHSFLTWTMRFSVIFAVLLSGLTLSGADNIVVTVRVIHSEYFPLLTLGRKEKTHMVEVLSRSALLKDTDTNSVLAFCLEHGRRMCPYLIFGS